MRRIGLAALLIGGVTFAAEYPGSGPGVGGGTPPSTVDGSILRGSGGTFVEETDMTVDASGNIVGRSLQIGTTTLAGVITYPFTPTGGVDVFGTIASSGAAAAADVILRIGDSADASEFDFFGDGRLVADGNVETLGEFVGATLRASAGSATTAALGASSFAFTVNDDIAAGTVAYQFDDDGGGFPLTLMTIKGGGDVEVVDDLTAIGGAVYLTGQAADDVALVDDGAGILGVKIGSEASYADVTMGNDLRFEGTAATFPMFRRNATVVETWLADASAPADFACSSLRTNNGSGTGFETVVGPRGQFYGRATTSYVAMGSSSPMKWSDNADGLGGAEAARILPTAITSGTMTRGIAQAVPMTVAFTWTNAQVVALGGVTAGDILVGTLPAKTVITNVYMVVGTAETALTSLTGAVGRTGATYIDYIVASNLKAAANTVYGDATAERGTNLTGYDMPSYTGTTAVNLHLVSGVENLSTAVACTGTVFVTYYVLP